MPMAGVLELDVLKVSSSPNHPMILRYRHRHAIVKKSECGSGVANIGF